MKIPAGVSDQSYISPAEKIDSLPLRTIVARMRGVKDHEKVALVIEGGGMSGVVSGGMSSALEDLGLVPYFDMIVGCSSGALNASYLSSGEGRRHAALYFESAATKGFINKKRAFLGKPVMELSILFEQLMVHNRPYSPKVLENLPELYIVAFNTNELRLESLRDFQTTDEVRVATKASCSIPGVTGELVHFRDSLYADGGLVESIPFHVAQSLGATQCLVLRSRSESYRKESFTTVEKSIGKILLRNTDKFIKDLVRERNAAYNRDADSLASQESLEISQVCPSEKIYLPDTFEASHRNLMHGFFAGSHAIKKALLDV